MDPKILIVIAAVLWMTATLSKHRRTIALPFTLALFVALLWTSFYRYEYVGSNLFLFNRINVYSLVVGTTTLTQLYVLHRHLPKRYSVLLTSALYIVLLGLFEAIGYHLLGIHLKSNFPSLLGLGIIHAPLSMKIFYLLIGPAYILTLHLLGKRLPQIRN